MTSATSRSAFSGNSICRDQPGSSVTRSVTLIDREHALGDLGDIAGLDGVDVPGTGSGRGDSKDAAPGADVEHHVVGAHSRSQSCQVVTGPAFVVEHARVFDRIRPTAGRRSPRVGRDQRALLDEHVEHVQRRRQVRRVVLALEPIERVTEPRRLREQRQDPEAPRPDVDDRPHV